MMNIQVRASSLRPSVSPKLDHLSKPFLASFLNFKPLLKELQQKRIFHHVPTTIKEAFVTMLDALVDSVFEFSDQLLLPSQANFAPVEEIGKAVDVTDSVRGRIPDDFPVGVYIRNGAFRDSLSIVSYKLQETTISGGDRLHILSGSNPLFGGLKSTKSILGKSSHTWIEGEGMLHALHFFKDKDGRWMIMYKNRHVETDTFKLEKTRKKEAFLPAIEGDSLAVLSAYILNFLRFGFVNKYLSNTSVFEHAGKFYSVSENHLPQEIDIFTLETRQNWDVNGSWKRPFTSHPKKAPGSEELVIMGIYPEKPYFELGVISADGSKLLHKVDLNLNRCCLCHEIGITKRYNVIMDFPLTLDMNRLISGGPLIKYDKEGYARIGVMPRYGDADSVRWFEVEPCCTFHIINCYEQDDDVVLLACRARNSIIPGPDFGLDKFEWFSKGFEQIGSQDEKSENDSFLLRAYEWRLNMQTGEVSEKNLTGSDKSMDFPIINENYIGMKNKYGYTQVINQSASAISGMAKYGALAKLHLQEVNQNGKQQHEELIKVEYHLLPENTFCSGSAFVARPGGAEEDNGWVITYVHEEDSNMSQVYIVDARNLSDEPVAIIDLPARVPYGFHGAFMTLQPSKSMKQDYVDNILDQHVYTMDSSQ